jgi:4-amino-4-deoxy-L-arabinose transferase-like glycosyltransferase
MITERSRPGEPVAPVRSVVRRRAIAALVVLALVVRIVVVIATPHFVPVTDAGEFDHIAVSLARTGHYPPSSLTQHGGPSAFRPPMFPGVLAIVYKIVGTGSEHTRWDAGRVMEAFLGALVVWLVALIATRLWGWRIGLVAGVIAALWPPLVMVGSSLMSESVFIPLVVASVWAALVGRDTGRLRWAVLAGAFVGLLALTRGNGSLMVIPIGFLVWTRRPRFSRAALKAPLAVLVAAIVVLLPWTIRNYEDFHSLVPVTTEAGYGLAGTYNTVAQDSKHYPGAWLPPLPQMRQAFSVHPDANEVVISNTLTHEATHYIREHPTSLITTFYWNTLRLLNLTGTGVEHAFAGAEGYATFLVTPSVYALWVLLAVCALALCLSPYARRTLRAAPLAVWGCPLIVWLTTAPLLGLTRYRSPADPFLIFVAAIALVTTWDRAAPLRARLRVRDRGVV